MIKLENTEVLGWEAAVRGIRTSTHSCRMSDSQWCFEYEACGDCPENILTNSVCPMHHNTTQDTAYVIGPNDYELIIQLCNRGSIFARFKEMITVSVDITAPLYFWNEFHNFGVGKLGYPYSLLDRIHNKKFELDDFSNEHLIVEDDVNRINMIAHLQKQIDILNEWRLTYRDVMGSTVSAKSAKEYWYQMIQLLPMSYNETQTVQLTYVELADIYYACRDSKLDEFKEFKEWIRGLPYSEFITGR